MGEELKKIEQAFRARMYEVRTLDRLEALRVSYLGRKGALAAIFGSLKTIAREKYPYL